MVGPTQADGVEVPRLRDTYTRCIVIVARYNKQSRWKDLIISVTAVGREVNPVIIPDTGNTYT